MESEGFRWAMRMPCVCMRPAYSVHLTLCMTLYMLPPRIRPLGLSHALDALWMRGAHPERVQSVSRSNGPACMYVMRV